MRHRLCLLVVVLSLLMAAGVLAETSYLGHFAVVPNQWATELTLTNPTGVAQSVTLTIYDDQGVSRATKTLSLPANGGISSQLNQIVTNLPIQIGWVQIDSQTSAVKGIMKFTYLPTSGTSSLPTVYDKGRQLIYPLIENSAAWMSGFAAVNTTNQTANLQMSIYNFSGTLLDTAATTLGPHSKYLNMASSAFSASLPEKAILVVQSDQDITGFALSLASDYSNIVAVPASVITGGVVQGSVINAVTANGVSGATITVFNSTGQQVGTATTDSNGQFQTSLSSGTYRLHIEMSGYLPVDYYGVQASASGIEFLETIQLIPTSSQGNGNAEGTIISALDGSPLDGVRLDLRAGINNSDGSVLDTVYTDSNGDYQFTGMPAGLYTARADLTGYSPGSFTLVVIGSQTTSNQNYTLTPVIAQGEIRVVLTWGELPYDLDSHMTGPDGSGGRFHVFYQDEGSVDSSPYCALDYDDTDSYGPETITIYHQYSGVYRYSVHDYSDRNLTSSLALSQSQAKVVVYDSNGIRAQFNVPVNTGGTLWTVFELNGDTITPINNMSYVSDPAAVTKNRLVTTDADVIRADMTEKK